MSTSINLEQVKNDKIKHRTLRGNKISEIKKKQQKVKIWFSTLFEEITDLKYTFEKKRFVSFIKEDKVYRKLLQSDNKRLWDCYNRITTAYKATDEEFIEYMRYVLMLIFKNGRIHKRTKIMGHITSEKIADEYFFKNRIKTIAGKINNKKLQSMAQKHAEYFE